MLRELHAPVRIPTRIMSMFPENQNTAPDNWEPILHIFKMHRCKCLFVSILVEVSTLNNTIYIISIDTVGPITFLKPLNVSANALQFYANNVDFNFPMLKSLFQFSIQC